MDSSDQKSPEMEQGTQTPQKPLLKERKTSSDFHQPQNKAMHESANALGLTRIMKIRSAKLN
jgi:hypothetical protein